MFEDALSAIESDALVGAALVSGVVAIYDNPLLNDVDLSLLVDTGTLVRRLFFVKGDMGEGIFGVD